MKSKGFVRTFIFIFGMVMLFAGVNVKAAESFASFKEGVNEYDALILNQSMQPSINDIVCENCSVEIQGLKNGFVDTSEVGKQQITYQITNNETNETLSLVRNFYVANPNPLYYNDGEVIKPTGSTTSNFNFTINGNGTSSLTDSNNDDAGINMFIATVNNAAINLKVRGLCGVSYTTQTSLANCAGVKYRLVITESELTGITRGTGNKLVTGTQSNHLGTRMIVLGESQFSNISYQSNSNNYSARQLIISALDGSLNSVGSFYLTYYNVAGEISESNVQDVRMYVNYSDNYTTYQINTKNTTNYIWQKIMYKDSDTSTPIELSPSVNIYGLTNQFEFNLDSAVMSGNETSITFCFINYQGNGGTQPTQMCITKDQDDLPLFKKANLTVENSATCAQEYCDTNKGYYNAGDKITLKLEFDRDVEFISNNAPYIKVSFKTYKDSNSGIFICENCGERASVFKFSYIIQEGDSTIGLSNNVMTIASADLKVKEFGEADKGASSAKYIYTNAYNQAWWDSYNPYFNYTAANIVIDTSNPTLVLPNQLQKTYITNQNQATFTFACKDDYGENVANANCKLDLSKISFKSSDHVTSSQIALSYTDNNLTITNNSSVPFAYISFTADLTTVEDCAKNTLKEAIEFIVVFDKHEIEFIKQEVVYDENHNVKLEITLKDQGLAKPSYIIAANFLSSFSYSYSGFVNETKSIQLAPINVYMSSPNLFEEVGNDVYKYTTSGGEEIHVETSNISGIIKIYTRVLAGCTSNTTFEFSLMKTSGYEYFYNEGAGSIIVCQGPDDPKMDAIQYNYVEQQKIELESYFSSLVGNINTTHNSSVYDEISYFGKTGTIYIYITNVNEMAVSLGQAYIVEFKECFNGSAKCTPSSASSLFTYNDGERVSQKRIDKTVTQNGYYCFTAIYNSGYEISDCIKITNVDRTAPELEMIGDPVVVNYVSGCQTIADSMPANCLHFNNTHANMSHRVYYKIYFSDWLYDITGV